MQKDPCIILIGMPGAGKSTLGVHLAEMLNYAFIDSDYLLESIYARRLEDVTAVFDSEKFRDAECEVICSLNASHCVLATGGSVIYRPRAMAHLQKLGILIHLNLPLEIVLERVALNPERGISFARGQSLEDLYHERKKLYEKYASLTYDTEKMNPRECAAKILADLNIKLLAAL